MTTRPVILRSSRPDLTQNTPRPWCLQVVENMVPEGGVEPPLGVNLTGF